jgi:hypothetical protein
MELPSRGPLDQVSSPISPAADGVHEMTHCTHYLECTRLWVEGSLDGEGFDPRDPKYVLDLAVHG